MGISPGWVKAVWRHAYNKKHPRIAETGKKLFPPAFASTRPRGLGRLEPLRRFPTFRAFPAVIPRFV
jgi:hypothetical protein